MFDLKIAPSGMATGRPVAGHKLAALILLGGRVRLTELSRLVGRHRLALPIDDQRSLLDYWAAQAAELAAAWGVDHLTMRVLLDQTSPPPGAVRLAEGGGRGRVTVSLERDPLELRGTAGVLRDACADYAGDELVLVANAAQMIFRPLTELAADLATALREAGKSGENTTDAKGGLAVNDTGDNGMGGGGLALASHLDGTPCGLMLMRCAALEAVPKVGFHDLKEQIIPAIAQRFGVRAVRYEQATCCPIRSREDYLAALRQHHRLCAGLPAQVDPLDENWRPTFAICEGDGEGVAAAVVDPSARIHDSVVLRGAHVGRNAVIVRSVIAEGVHIPPGQVLIDQLVSSAR